MSALMGTKKGTADKRVQAVSDCGTRVLYFLRGRFTIPDDLRLEVESHIRQLPSVAVLAEKAGPLDVLGTDLWNASAGLIHLDDHQLSQHSKNQPSDYARLGVTIRVFAFLLLEIAHVSISRHINNEVGRVRIVKIAFKASRLCLEATALDYALRTLERCAEYVSLPGAEAEPSSLQESTKEVQVVNAALQTEYCLLRIMCAWKSDRLDTAHHFYLRLCSIGVDTNQTLVQEAADLFWCIARACARDVEIDTTMLWMERGLAVLNICDAETFNDETAELQLNLTSDLVKQLLCSGNIANIERASQLVNELESQPLWHNRIIVQVLKFQTLVSTSPIDASKIEQALTRVMRMIVLTESNFKMVMQMTSKVSTFSLRTSLTVATFFICTRLIPDELNSDQEHRLSKKWMAKAIVAFIHMLASQVDSIMPTAPSVLRHLLDSVVQSVGHVLTSTEIHACQALIWKIMQNAENGDLMEWCSMLQHTLFDGASAGNKARISRRSISIALDIGDITSARQTYEQLPEETRNEAITRYLAFKIALSCQDHQLARDSLDVIARGVDKDATYLFACVLEAQQSASRKAARLALQALMLGRPAGVGLPSLLRAIAHLLIAELDDPSCEIEEIASEIAKILETAVNEIFETPNREMNDRMSKEIEWWTKSTYNLVIRIFTRAGTNTIIRLLHVCGRFFRLFAETALNQLDDIKGHQMICDFLSATAQVIIGRSGDTSPENVLQAYRDTRSHVKSYMITRSEMETTENDSLELKRTLEMLKYDLEGILRLEQWDSVDSALRSCLNLQSVERWDTLADLLVVLHEHMNRFSQDSNTGRLLTEVLQKIINETWRHEKDIVKVTRWVRWTFSICLADRQSNFSFKLLEQAVSMAANGQDGKHDYYPEAELQWLASSSFNHAIDLVSHGDVDAAEPWLENALELARWAQDSGSLHQILTRKRDIMRERSIRSDKREMLKST